MNPSSELLLYGAVRQNDLKRAERLLHEGKADPNKIPKILIHACAEGHLEMVELLITNPSNPANVNLDSEWVYRGVPCITRPIWVAVKSKNLKVLRLLLWKAYVKVDLECTKTFVKKDNGRPGCTYECTPLWQAVMCQQEPVEEELIKAGANVNAIKTVIWGDGPGPLVRQTTTESLLTYAVRCNRIALCRCLIQHGCDLSARSTKPRFAATALDVAIVKNNPEMFYFLLQHIPTGNNDILASAMLLAISEDTGPKYIEALIRRGGYKLGKHWHPASVLSEQEYINEYSDELMYGIKVEAEDCCVTLLQYGYKVDASTEHFSLAVKQGMVRLMFHMVQQNPQVLQQSWLHDPEEFGELPQHAVHWLHKVRRQPDLLKGICEARLLQALRPSPTNI